MTHEEMAQVLDAAAEGRFRMDRESPLPEACRAGAAALRAMGWKPIADAPNVSRFGFIAGHVGSERMDHCFDRDTAIWLMHTHYRELPAPPEGV